MYKRPPLRVREPTRVTNEPTKLTKGSFLYELLNPPPTVCYKHVKAGVYQKEAYFNLLKKNCKQLGIEYKEPDIPDYIPKKVVELSSEPKIAYLDWVYMKVRILKSGIVRIKLDTSLATLYEKYYSNFKQPHSKFVIQAYKSLGFSNEFLERLKKRFDNKLLIEKKIGAIIDKVFNKEPVKKIKKKKKEEEFIEEPEEEVEEQDDDQEQEDDGDDEGMDVEVEEDPDEQPQEEEYFSDGGD